MKKLFFSLVVAMIATTATFAQTSLVATLTHGDDVSMYYGTYALRDAYQAAVSGDVINLSGGTFQAVNINKAITLRGAGIDAASPTFISGYFTINIPTEDTGRLSMEGIKCTEQIIMDGTFSNAYFLKCKYKSIMFDSRSNIKNIMFADCKITDHIVLYGATTAQFINSYIHAIDTDVNTSVSFINCIIRPSYGYSFSDISCSQLLNCILIHSNTSYTPLPSTSSATNCVLVGSDVNIFSESQSSTNCISGVSFADMFVDYTGNYTDEQTFELTSTAQTTYLGTDGTQVGIYGGLLPYTSTPSYP